MCAAEAVCRGYDGAERLLFALRPTAFCLRRDEDAPADSLEVTLPEVALGAVCSVEFAAGAVRFAGVVDEQNERFAAGVRETELVCRSFEAVLLDNPALPGTVRNPSRAVMEYWQLRPLGLRCAGADGTVFGGEMTVRQGTGLYDALLTFARTYFGEDAAVRMDDRRTVRFGRRESALRALPAAQETVCCYRPVERLSEAVAQSSVSRCYSATTVNRGAREAGVMRRRYLPAGTAMTAGERIAQAERRALRVQVRLPCAWEARPGDRVAAPKEVNGAENELRVRAVVCRGDGAKMVTDVTLTRG